jgi:hypothetical protein
MKAHAFGLVISNDRLQVQCAAGVRSERPRKQRGSRSPPVSKGVELAPVIAEPKLEQPPRTRRPLATHLLQVAATAAPSTQEFKYLPLDLPPPQHTKVTASEFLKSSAGIADCPHSPQPEFAVIGRSNVGKSSLINCLANNSKLAKVSKEPGG